MNRNIRIQFQGGGPHAVVLLDAFNGAPDVSNWVTAGNAMSTLAGIEALRLFSAVLVGGGRINPKMLSSAAKLRINVVTTYGSSETSGGCVYNGRPLEGVEIAIQAPDAEGAGRILISGPILAEDYLDYPRMSAMVEKIDEYREDGGVILPSFNYDEWYVAQLPAVMPKGAERQVTVYFLNLGITLCH